MTCAGSMQRSEVMPSATHQATSSSQARGLDISAVGTDAASVDKMALRRLTRQLNSLRRQDLLLGRFESMGPRQRRHGGTQWPCCSPSELLLLHLELVGILYLQVEDGRALSFPSYLANALILTALQEEPMLDRF